MIVTPYTFGATDTIIGVLKLKNGHDTTPTKVQELLVLYNELNGNTVPKPGQTVSIPILT